MVAATTTDVLKDMDGNDESNTPTEDITKPHNDGLADENTMMQQILRHAAKEEDHPNISDDWLVFGFGTGALEKSYQATLAPARAQGTIVYSVLAAIFSVVVTFSGGLSGQGVVAIFVAPMAVAFCARAPL